MHPRQKIRSKLLSLLKGSTSAGDRVFINRTNNFQDENLPAITIFYVSESVEQLNVAPVEFQRTLQLMIEAVAEGKTESAMTDTLDQLADELEQIVIKENEIKDESLLIDRVMLGDVDFEFRGDGEVPIGAVRTNFTVMYRTAVRDDIATDDLTKGHADWNIDKTNDSDDPNNDFVFEAEDDFDVPSN